MRKYRFERAAALLVVVLMTGPTLARDRGTRVQAPPPPAYSTSPEVALAQAQGRLTGRSRDAVRTNGKLVIVDKIVNPTCVAAINFAQGGNGQVAQQVFANSINVRQACR